MRLIRVKKFRASIRKFKVFVDDIEVTTISNNQGIDLDVSEDSMLYVTMGKLKSNVVRCDSDCLFVEFTTLKSYSYIIFIISFIGSIFGALLGQSLVAKGFIDSWPIMLVVILYVFTTLMVDKMLLKENKIGIRICDIK
jgi:hypothetical protein